MKSSTPVPPLMEGFRYSGPPDATNAPKQQVPLARAPLLRADVQILGDRGANNLHSHTGEDGFWFVLAGHAKFYDENDNVIGDLGPSEGIVTPANSAYWFESAGTERLEVLHVTARDPLAENTRVDHRPRSEKGAAREA